MMRAWGLLFLIAVSAMCVGLSAQASTLPNAGKNNKLDSGEINQDPLRGLIINRTMTTLGWDFYKSFSGVWQALHPDSEFTLTVTERPTAQFGSEIWVTYHNTTLYHAFLSPARSRVNETAKKAAQIVYSGLGRIEQEQKVLSTDSDLAPAEF
jgi:curli production assembly/transport component CsgE